MRIFDKYHYQAKFFPEAHYHIYSRTNNREILFRNDADRLIFLKKAKEYLVPWVNLYAYCLIPNHFHFAIQVKTQKELVKYCNIIPELKRSKVQDKFAFGKDLTDKDYHDLIKNQFSSFFVAYATYINKKYKRYGNLFHRPFKRIILNKETSKQRVVEYIHRNPLKHKIYKDHLRYPWSSYESLLSTEKTALDRDLVWEIFGSKASFIKYHTIRDEVSSPTLGGAYTSEQTAPNFGDAASPEQTAPNFGDAASPEQTAPNFGDAASLEQTAPKFGDAASPERKEIDEEADDILFWEEE